MNVDVVDKRNLIHIIIITLWPLDCKHTHPRYITEGDREVLPLLMNL